MSLDSVRCVCSYNQEGKTICLCQVDLIEKLTNSSFTSNFRSRTLPNNGIDGLGVQ